MVITDYKHKVRSYLHFDPQISHKVAKLVVTDPQRVATHPFYPLLGFTIVTPKVTKNSQGKLDKKDKKRPIKLAAHIDAAIYSYYGQILSEKYERAITSHRISDSVTAFRKIGGSGKNNIHFAKEIFSFIQNNRPCTAIGLDVEKFFDTLDHRLLKQRWASILGTSRLPDDHFNVFKSLSNFQWVDRNSAYEALGISPHNPNPKNSHRKRLCCPKTFRDRIRAKGLIWKNPEIANKRGIPQGAPISALLSNVYMLDFDVAMAKAVSSMGGLYRRYCDDIMIVVPNQNTNSIEAFANDEIKKLKLSINQKKTTRAEFPIDANHQATSGAKIQYLGFDFNGTQTLIRASSLGRYYGKMRRGVSLARQTQKKHNSMREKKGLPPTPLRMRQLYIRYTYLIKRRFHNKKGKGERQNVNFITYAHQAAKILNAPEIKHQVRNHFKKLLNAAHKNNAL